MSADRCQHEAFEVVVGVNRLRKAATLPITGYAADIHVFCKQCDEPFVFIGIPVGLRPGQPMCSVDGTEARMPIRPKSAPENFGLDFPGFHVEVKP